MNTKKNLKKPESEKVKKALEAKIKKVEGNEKIYK